MNIVKNEKGSGGIGFLGLLAVLFIGLKITGYISWSWWLVTLPIWGSFIIVAVVLIIMGILAVISK